MCFRKLNRMHLTLWLVQTLLLFTSQTVSSAPSTSTVGKVEDMTTNTPIISTETEAEVLPSASPLRETIAGRRAWRRPLSESLRRRRFEGQNRRSQNTGLPMKPINRFGGKLKFTPIDQLETFHLTQEDFDNLQQLPIQRSDHSSNFESVDPWNRRNYKPEQPLFESHSSDPWARKRQPIAGKDLSDYKFFDSAAGRSHPYNNPREFKDMRFVTSSSYGDMATTSTESANMYSDAEIFGMKYSQKSSELDRNFYEDSFTTRERSRKFRPEIYEEDRNDKNNRRRDQDRSRPTSYFNMSSRKTRTNNKIRSGTDEDSDAQLRFEDFEKIDHYPKNQVKGRENYKKPTPPTDRQMNHRRRTTSTTERSHEVSSPKYRTRSFTATSTERNFDSKKRTTAQSTDEGDGYSIHDLAGPPYHDDIPVKGKDIIRDWKLNGVTTPKTKEKFSLENSFDNMFNTIVTNANSKSTDDMSNYNPHHKYSTELEERREVSRRKYSNSDLGKSPDKSIKQTSRVRNNLFNMFGKFDDELAFNSHEFNSKMTDKFFPAKESWEKHDYERQSQDGNAVGFQNYRRMNSFEMPRNRDKASYYSEEDHFGDPYHEIDTRQYDIKNGPAFGRNNLNGGYGIHSNSEESFPQYDTGNRHFAFGNNKLRNFHTVTSVEHLQDYDNKIQHVKLDQLEEFPKSNEQNSKQFRPNWHNSRQRQIPNFAMNEHISHEGYRPGRNISPGQFATVSRETFPQTHFNIPSDYPDHMVALRGGERFSSDAVRLATLRRKRNNRLSLSDTDQEEPEEQSWSLGNLIPDSIGNLFGRKK